MIELINKSEAAKLLAVSEHTVERLIAAGQLPAYKIHRACIRLDRAEVLAYIESRRVRSAALAQQIKPFSVKDLRRRKQIEALPCPYKPGDKVV